MTETTICGLGTGPKASYQVCGGLVFGFAPHSAVPVLEAIWTPGILPSPEPLFSEPMVAVLPVEHPLAPRDNLRVDDLVDERLILFPNDLMPAYVAQIWAMFAAIGAEPVVVQEAIHHETVAGLVSAGVGISILPASVSRFRPADVVIRPIEGAPTTALLIARPEESSNPAVDGFVECLRAAQRVDG